MQRINVCSLCSCHSSRYEYNIMHIIQYANGCYAVTHRATIPPDVTSALPVLLFLP